MKRTGTFWRIPYHWQRPSWQAIKDSMWNPSERRIFTPPAFGWGWNINVYEVLRRLGLVK